MRCDVGEVTESLESSFSKISVTSPTSQLILILQAFRHFTYVTTHSPTLPSLYLRHNSFSNPFIASPTSHLILQPLFRFSYVTGFSLTLPGEPPMVEYHPAFDCPKHLAPIVAIRLSLWQVLEKKFPLHRVSDVFNWREIWGSYWLEQLFYNTKSTLCHSSRMWTCVVLLNKHINFLSKKWQ